MLGRGWILPSGLWSWRSELQGGSGENAWSAGCRRAKNRGRSCSKRSGSRRSRGRRPSSWRVRFGCALSVILLLLALALVLNLSLLNVDHDQKSGFKISRIFFTSKKYFCLFFFPSQFCAYCVNARSKSRSNLQIDQKLLLKPFLNPIFNCKSHILGYFQALESLPH